MSHEKDSIPAFYLEFRERFKEVGDQYENLGKAVHQQGPLDERTRALVKLAISGSSGLNNAFRTHVRKARQQGLTREEMEHVALLFLPTKGLSTTMKALKLIKAEFEND